MKISKNKKVLLVVLVVLVVAATMFLVIKVTSSTTKRVKVLDYGLSACTMNLPSSICGPYDVNVQSLDGKKASYSVAGFENRNERERYYDISSLIQKAKRTHTTVILSVDKDGVITAIK